MGYQRNHISHIHRGTLNAESQKTSCGIIPPICDHAGNILFKCEPPIFPKLTGIKSVYNQGRNLFYLLAGKV